MDCTRCKSSNKVKRGVINGRQRYTCKDCGYNYTVVQKSTSKPDSIKRKALQLYLEGLGFRSIGRILQVSHVSVYNWSQFTNCLKGDSLVKGLKPSRTDRCHSLPI